MTSEFLMQYTTLRSSYFDVFDTSNAERGSVPMKYMIVLAKSYSTSQGASPEIFDYFAEEWSKLHPEAFDDSDR